MLNQAEGWFRRWFAKVWKARGGGFYALGFAATFIYLEITTVASEFVESASLMAFITEQLIEFVLRFAIDSIRNMVMAFLWPVFWVQWQPPFGAIALVIAYFVFAKFVKQPWTGWLFPDGHPTEQDRGPEGKSTRDDA